MNVTARSLFLRVMPLVALAAVSGFLLGQATRPTPVSLPIQAQPLVVYERKPAVVLSSMRGCASLAVPVDPVPVTRAWSRCDPARLGWAAEGSFFWTQQVWPLAEALPVEMRA